ncbi:MAG: DUF2384 domain-containing protein [Desulfobacteraceae bacterium]|nr:DUF2384 domain-containing protein [Desulfobacteraceae bacterium]
MYQKDVSRQIEQIRKGVPIKMFNQIRKETGLSEKRIAQVISISISTLAIRKKAGTLKPHESERLYRIKRIYEKAMTVFEENKEIVKKWLVQPVRALGNVAPIDYADTDIGAIEVENLLGRIEYGIPS